MTAKIAKLAGLAEIAGLAGVSRTRAGQLAAHPDFPEPVDRLAMGPVWREDDVKAFLATPRKAGRRPKGEAAVLQGLRSEISPAAERPVQSPGSNDETAETTGDGSTDTAGTGTGSGKVTMTTWPPTENVCCVSASRAEASETVTSALWPAWRTP